MKKLLERIENIVLHDLTEKILWGIFTIFCCGVAVWMVISLISGFNRAKSVQDELAAKKSKVVACVERKYRVKHIIFDMFEESDGTRFNVSNYGECGENPDL